MVLLCYLLMTCGLTQAFLSLKLLYDLVFDRNIFAVITFEYLLWTAGTQS